MSRRVYSKLRISQGVLGSALLAWSVAAQPAPSLMTGSASWYGEAHRGKLMANGKAFNPDKFTAASWFYPLKTRLLITCKTPNRKVKSVVVTVTDRGPARRLVTNGRVIDLSHAAFEKLAAPSVGLVEVSVRPESQNQRDTMLAENLSCQRSSTLCGVKCPEEPVRAAVNDTVGAEKKLP